MRCGHHFFFGLAINPVDPFLVRAAAPSDVGECRIPP